MKAPKFNIGDQIAYSVQFLRSIGESHGEMARGRGEISGLTSYGSNFTLADITWSNGADLPDKVNIHNLAKVGANSRFCAC